MKTIEAISSRLGYAGAFRVDSVKIPLSKQERADILDAIKQFPSLAKEQFLVSTPSSFRHATLAHLAADIGEDAILEALCEADPEVVNAEMPENKATPLHAAASGGYTSTVSLLLNKGSHWNATTIEGYTPFRFALFHGYTDVMDILLKQDPRQINQLHKTIIPACFSQKAVQLFPEGILPLHYAILRGNYNLVHWAIRNGADLLAGTPADQNYAKTAIEAIAGKKLSTSIRKNLLKLYGTRDALERSMEGRGMTALEFACFLFEDACQYKRSSCVNAFAKKARWDFPPIIETLYDMTLVGAKYYPEEFQKFYPAIASEIPMQKKHKKENESAKQHAHCIMM